MILSFCTRQVWENSKMTAGGSISSVSTEIMVAPSAETSLLLVVSVYGHKTLCRWDTTCANVWRLKNKTKRKNIKHKLSDKKRLNGDAVATRGRGADRKWRTYLSAAVSKCLTEREARPVRILAFNEHLRLTHLLMSRGWGGRGGV